MIKKTVVKQPVKKSKFIITATLGAMLFIQYKALTHEGMNATMNQDSQGNQIVAESVDHNYENIISRGDIDRDSIPTEPNVMATASPSTKPTITATVIPSANPTAKPTIKIESKPAVATTSGQKLPPFSTKKDDGLMEKWVFDELKIVGDKLGLPVWVWYPIAMYESNGDPKNNTTTKKESSHGIFQINIMAHHDVDMKRVYYPTYNANYQMPTLKNVYDEAIKKGMTGTAVVKHVARYGQCPDWQNYNTRKYIIDSIEKYYPQVR